MVDPAKLLHEDENVLWASESLGKQVSKDTVSAFGWSVLIVFLIVVLLVLPTQFALPDFVLNAITGLIIILFFIGVISIVNLNFGAKNTAPFAVYCLTDKRLILSDASYNRQVSILPSAIIRLEIFPDEGFQSVSVLTSSRDENFDELKRVANAKELKRLMLTHWPSANGATQ